MPTAHAPSTQDILEAVERLAPTVSTRAAETERSRRIPPDLLGDLTSAGCFRVVLPRSHGGAGATLPAAMQLFETLGAADASTGWTVMIGACGWVDLAPLPRDTFDTVYARGADTITAGAFSPSGTATPVDGGYRIEGRWAFASGCEHASWLYGNCIEPMDGGGRIRTALLAADEVSIEDTWDVVGLRGTGSHHFHVHDLLVPAARTCLALEDPPQLDEPIVRIPPPALFAMTIGAVAVGIAQGALAEVTGLASAKVPLLGAATLAENPHFQLDLGSAQTQIAAARSLLYERAQAAWQTAVDSEPFTMVQRADMRSAAAFAASQAAATVDTAYRAGGGTSLYSESPLQRRLRDIHALTQHFLVKAETFATAGAVYAGLEPDVMVF